MAGTRARRGLGRRAVGPLALAAARAAGGAAHRRHRGVVHRDARHPSAGRDALRALRPAGHPGLRSRRAAPPRRARSSAAPARAGVRLPPAETPDSAADPDHRPHHAGAAGVVRAGATRGGTRWSSRSRWRPETVRLEGSIDNSLYEALDAQVGDDVLDAPERQRLAWDLADVYAWQVDFTRDIQIGRPLPGRDRAAGLGGGRGPVRPGAGQRPHDVGQEPHRLPLRRAATGRPSTTPTATRSGGRSSARRSSSAASPRASPARAGIPSSASPGGTRAPTTPRARARRSWPRATASCSAPDGPAATATWSSCATATESPPATATCAASPAASAPALGSPRDRRSATSAAPASRAGPHLHYEFRVNGVAKDSRRVELGNGAPIGAADRAAFEQQRDSLLLLLQAPPGDRDDRLVAGPLDLYPAIDIRQGRVVRLSQGEATRQTVYGDDAAARRRALRRARARRGSTWWTSTARWARATTRPPCAGSSGRSAAGSRVQLGGGFRSLERVAAGLDLGVARLVIGTAAATDPAFVTAAAATARSPGRLAVGVDARDGLVAVRGWTETSTLRADDLVQRVVRRRDRDGRLYRREPGRHAGRGGPRRCGGAAGATAPG